jgi:SAM-dependent methyltransferase
MNSTVTSLRGAIPSRSLLDLPSPQSLTERAHPGLHAEILEHILARVQTRGPLLDLACGTGAWLARLQRQGFDEVLGTDSDVRAFGLDRALHVPSNLDQAFSQKIKRHFDFITAIEILEHVESPTGFLREARQLINPGGYMFVTTPNVECVQGRLRFLAQGKLRAFEDDKSADPSYLSPLLTSLMPRVAERSGWTIQERIDLLKNTSPLIVRFWCQLLGLFLGGKAKRGDCHLYILRPAEGPKI